MVSSPCRSRSRLMMVCSLWALTLVFLSLVLSSRLFSRGLMRLASKEGVAGSLNTHHSTRSDTSLMSLDWFWRHCMVTDNRRLNTKHPSTTHYWSRYSSQYSLCYVFIYISLISAFIMGFNYITEGFVKLIKKRKKKVFGVPKTKQKWIQLGLNGMNGSWSWTTINECILYSSSLGLFSLCPKNTSYY